MRRLLDTGKSASNLLARRHANHFKAQASSSRPAAGTMKPVLGWVVALRSRELRAGGSDGLASLRQLGHPSLVKHPKAFLYFQPRAEQLRLAG